MSSSPLDALRAQATLTEGNFQAFTPMAVWRSWQVADFCRDCTIELVGEEYAIRNDFIFPNWEKGSFGWVLCEHCGYIVVNRHGQSLMPLPPDDGNKYQLGEDERTWVLVEADDA